MVLDTFSKRLRAYRKLKHLTQNEFANVMGVSKAVVGGWERGTREPTEAQFEEMMRVLNVTRDDLGLTMD